MELKLWVVDDEHNGYDDFSAAVVWATTSEEALSHVLNDPMIAREISKNPKFEITEAPTQGVVYWHVEPG